MDNYILIRGARQLLTLRGAPGIRYGCELNDLGIIEDGAVLIKNKNIAAVGSTRRIENLREAKNAAVILATGRVVLPGFVDPGMRALIGDTMRPMKRPSQTRIGQEALGVLGAALQHGTTRPEVKVGGTTAAGELKALRHTKRLDPTGEKFIRTWLIRLRPPGSEAHPLSDRAETFSYFATRLSGGFVEVEASRWSAEIARCLFRKAAEHQLSCKLTWHGPPDGTLHDLLSHFPVQTLTLIESLRHADIQTLAGTRTVVIARAGETALRSEPDELRVRDLIDANAGVALSTGYDPTESPSYNMQMAITLAVNRMNLTLEEAIATATVNAAYASGIGAKVGTLEAGKRADLQVLNLTDYRDLPRQFGVNHVGLVIKSGTIAFNRIKWKAPQAK